MKSRITKFAVAAVAIIAVLLSITIMDKSTSSAYALEQIMKAYEGLRYVHIKDFKQGENEPQEFWVKFDEHEQVSNIRASIPAWTTSEGPLTAVWNDSKVQIWGKNSNGQVIVTKHKEMLGLEILNLVKKCDPRSAVKELYQLEAEGKMEIKTSKTTAKSEPIIITAKFLSQNNDAGNQIVLYADPNTMLVTRAVVVNAKEQHSWEFSDYNIEVDEKFFMLKEVPENVQRYYETAKYNSTEIGLAQGELGNNEIAAELARQFIQAMIDKDYEKAGKLCGGMPRMFGGRGPFYKKILSVEQPIRDVNSSTAILVPCVVAANHGGTTLVMQANVSVAPDMADSNRWVVDCNNIYKERLVIKDPTDTTSKFMKNININLALLDINKSTVADVIVVLGEPWAYRFHDEDLNKDDLPEYYTMDYPGSFIVGIYKNQITMWGTQQIPGHEIPGYKFSDSIQMGMTLDEVFKKLGPPAKVIEGFDDGRHGSNEVVYEDNIIYANMGINERKGFCFYRYGRSGEKIRTYYDDNVLYQDINGIEELCFYATVTKGKRIRIIFMNNKVIALYEYRTEPIEASLNNALVIGSTTQYALKNRGPN